MNYIIPEAMLNPIYAMQEVNALLIVTAVLIYVLIESKYTRYLVTALLLTLAVLNYAILWSLTRYEEVEILPLLVLEKVPGKPYASMAIDFTQISIVILLIIWRKEMVKAMNKIYQTIKQSRGKSIKTTQK